jgi:hypothetical protein
LSVSKPDLVEIVGDAIFAYYDGFGQHPGVTRAYGAAEHVVKALRGDGANGHRLVSRELLEEAATTVFDSARQFHDLFQSQGHEHFGSFEDCVHLPCQMERGLARRLQAVAAGQSGAQPFGVLGSQPFAPEAGR